MTKLPLAIVATLAAISLLPLAAAHVTHTAGAYSVKIGWDCEPAESGVLDHVTMQVWNTDTGEGVSGLVGNVTLTVKYTDQAKDLDVEESDEEPGNYSAPLDPTRPGLYVVHAKGTIDGVAIDQDFNIEEVQDLGDAKFPPQPDVQQEIATMQQQIAQLQAQVKTQSTTPATVTGATSGGKGVPALGVAVVLGVVGLAALLAIRRRGD